MAGYLPAPPLATRWFAESSFEVFSSAAFAHHLVEQVLYDHKQEKDLTLLTARHAREHLKKLWIDTLGERLAIVGNVRHASVAIWLVLGCADR